ncbi:hypothetical protein FB451DRAFT_1192376 [Mycena latifolia]|nr:hypothetical protein FB451DRAFT_1192376 [Mycena latifolia]
MSPQHTIMDIRLKNTIGCLNAAVAVLHDLSDAFGTPFLPTISNTTLSLIRAVQNVKKIKEDCIQLMEDVYQMLCTIANLHIKSETKGNLSPATLDHVEKFTKYDPSMIVIVTKHFTRTLHKIHNFVEVQSDGGMMKHFFRQAETKTLLSECRAGLKQAFEVFQTQHQAKSETGVMVLGTIRQIQEEADKVHKEVLELISTFSDGTISDRASSMYQFVGASHSSKSFSMLPAKPKIFHGREAELTEVVQTLQQESPRLAILGAGGMGKTSLAKAALHDPDIATKYEQCFFVVADSVTTSVELSALIGEHIGFKPANIQQVIQYFTTTGPSLLILDNLETSWEPMESRREVEELLSKLTDVPHLALVITMRGAERPAKVQWTRPFLSLLKPLSDPAARDIFFAIAEDMHDSKDVDEVLFLTDNMPLAVDLIAHAVDFEGSCSAVLARWKTEKTSMLSAGNDRKSNLDTSITISLSSSRMSTGAKDLLSLLSILPDGLSDVELVQSKLSINNIMTCKAALLATSLAYIDDKRHLKSLVPIREHLQRFYSPSPLFIHQLQRHFRQLLDVYNKDPRTQQGEGRVNELASNIRNMRELLLRGLNQDNPNLAETISCIFSLHPFIQQADSGYFHLIPMLMDQIEAVLPEHCDEEVKAQLIIWKFKSRGPSLSAHADLLITQAISYFHTFNDVSLEWNFYLQVGFYYFHAERKPSVALKYLYKALDFARFHGDIGWESLVLNYLGEIQWSMGDYLIAQRHARASHQLAEVSGDFYWQARALWILAACYRGLGDLRSGIHLTQRALKLMELCGTTIGSSYTNVLQDLAEAHLLRSEYTEARNILTQIARDAATQDPLNYAWTLLNLAQLDIMMAASKQDILHNLDKAKLLFNTYIGYFNGPSGRIYCDIELGKLHLREGEILTAKGILQTVFNSTWGNNAQGGLSCMESLANVSCWRESDFDWAARWTVVYLGYAKKLANKLALHQALQFLGDVFQAEGDSVTSTTLFTVALQGFTRMDIHRSRAECMLRLGDLAQGQGDVLKAIEFWKLARPLFERSSQANKVAKIDERLTTTTNDKLMEHNNSLTRLVHLNVPTAVVAEVTH